MQYCPFFDFAVWGEGEYALLELFQHIDEQSALQTVPGLVYRNVNGAISISEKSRKYVDMNTYTPDFDDYMEHGAIKRMMNRYNARSIWATINRTRGCPWNRCKFCSLNKSYLYRETEPEKIKAQMEYYINKYGIFQFQFVDNDIIGREIEQFVHLLDLIIELSKKKSHAIDIFAEVNPSKLHASIIKKMRAAGIKQVQIGFEALTDKLLEKMNKQIRFAHSILFIKFAIKYDILVKGVNIIRGIPKETTADVNESANNLHFLRFYLGEQNNRIKIDPIELSLQRGTPFYKELSGEELKRWGYNRYYDIIPHMEYGDAAGFFGFKNPHCPNFDEWKDFEIVYHEYLDARFTYSLTEDKGDIFFTEYYKGKAVNYIIFDKPIHLEIPQGGGLVCW